MTDRAEVAIMGSEQHCCPHRNLAWDAVMGGWNFPAAVKTPASARRRRIPSLLLLPHVHDANRNPGSLGVRKMFGEP